MGLGEKRCGLLAGFVVNRIRACARRTFLRERPERTPRTGRFRIFHPDLTPTSASQKASRTFTARRAHPPMDGDRKYKQNGYQDSGSNGGHRGGSDDRPRQQGPRLPLDITGPRLPRLVQNVVASRCFNCATALPPDADFKGACPKCATALHCCKQCAHFEPSTRFQCLKPIPERIPAKDKANACELFKPRVTVARDATQAAAMTAPQSVRQQAGGDFTRRPSDARAAFDSLFKK